MDIYTQDSYGVTSDTLQVEEDHKYEDLKEKQEHEFPNGIADAEDYSTLSEEPVDSTRDYIFDDKSLGVLFGEDKFMENKEVQISHHNKSPMKELNLRNAKTMKEEYSSSSVLFKSLSNISAKSEKIYISGNSLLFKSQNIDDFQDLPVILNDKLYKKSDMHLKTYCFNCIQDTS